MQGLCHPCTSRLVISSKFNSLNLSENDLRLNTEYIATHGSTDSDDRIDSSPTARMETLAKFWTKMTLNFRRQRRIRECR